MSPSTVDSPDAAPALRRYLDAMPRVIRERGLDYARRGRVETMARRSEREVEGAVRGERVYAVRLQRAGNHWMGVCTCPLGSRCKHLHALGLAWLGRLAPAAAAPAAGEGSPAEPAARPAFPGPGGPPEVDRHVAYPAGVGLPQWQTSQGRGQHGDAAGRLLLLVLRRPVL
ncbi:MAG: hypothetical protein ACO3G4_14180, partial [Opitutaceae bacterium]